jgi:hypothetical protein
MSEPLPDIPFLHARFKLQRTVGASPAGAGLMNYTETFTPVWTIDFATKPLLESQVSTLSGWWDSLREGLRSALVEQNVTCRPKAHWNPADAAPAQDTGVLDSITSGNQLAISSVSSSLVLAKGDLFGLEYSTFYGLARVVSVSGAGTSRAVTVEPPPRSYVGVATALVRFEDPKLIMRPVPRSFQLSAGARPTASFSLVESRS